MIARLLMLLAVGSISFLAIAGETYRWEDESGTVNYSDQPPPPGARNIRRTWEPDADEAEPLPYRLQMVVEKSPVTLYVTDCGEPCDSARELLMARGVPHTLLDVFEAKVEKELLALTGGKLEVPVVKIGKTVLHGFEEGKWNSALDAAGYPSYAMIEVRPYSPKSAEQRVTQDGDNNELATGDTDTVDAADAESDESELDESFVEDVDTGESGGDAADLADIEQ